MFLENESSTDMVAISFLLLTLRRGLALYHRSALEKGLSGYDIAIRYSLVIRKEPRRIDIAMLVRRGR